MGQTKICTKCGEEKSLDEFGVFPSLKLNWERKAKKQMDSPRKYKKKGYIFARCKVCINTASKEYARKNRTKIKESRKKWKGKAKEYGKKWREEHKKEIKKKYLDNKECIKERSRKYYSNNKEWVKEISKKYQEKNKEYLKELSKKWREKNKEQIKKNREELIDVYISARIGIPVDELRKYPELIEAKRLQIKIYREVQNH